MSQRPIHEWTASEIVKAIADGQASAESVARACLERIAAREPAVQAWQFLDPDLVIAQDKSH